jgi:hypothetical protein
MNKLKDRTQGRRRAFHGRKRQHGIRPYIELLEARCLLDADLFRTITGFDNNEANPTLGTGNTDLLRLSPVAYADGISAPSAFNDINPRHLSNVLNNQSDPIFSFNTATPQFPFADNNAGGQEHHLSDFAYVWGQFTDHDLDLTLDNSGDTSMSIQPDTKNFPNDPMGVQPFTRSNFDPNTGTSTSNPRQQVNTQSSFEDLSQVYGSTDAVADILRSHVGGQLRTGPGDNLPTESMFTAAELATLNQDEGGIANDAHQVPDSQLFVAGDKRVNENIELTAMHTVFLRNHNRLAGQLQKLHPDWTDEQLFQEARKLNIAEAEMVTFKEFLPAIFGVDLTSQYTGYDPTINPSISTEFSTVGFRFGHTLLSNGVGRNNNDGTQITDVNPNGSTINLAIDFFRPDLINNGHVPVSLTDLLGNTFQQTSSTVGEIMKADADNTANSMDLKLIDEIRNVLFGVPHGPGTDLAARDVQRARDHGIGTYNQVRQAFGLAPVTSFADITSDGTVQQALRAAYGTNPDGTDNVNAVDPFEGMLAEDHLPGTDAGPTESAIVLDQFRRLMLGDSFFYLNENFNTEELSLLAKGNSLAKILKNNTEITNLQSNVFFFKASISGTVFDDDNANGVQDFGEPGLAGFTVSLLDNNGNVVKMTTTDDEGNYKFTDLTGIPGTGNFSVAVVLRAGFTNTSPTSIAVALSRGGLHFDDVNFGVDESVAGATVATALSANALLTQTPATVANGAVTQRQAPAAPDHVALPVSPAASSLASTIHTPDSGAASPEVVDPSAGNVL